MQILPFDSQGSHFRHNSLKFLSHLIALLLLLFLVPLQKVYFDIELHNLAFLFAQLFVMLRAHLLAFGVSVLKVHVLVSQHNGLLQVVISLDLQLFQLFLALLKLILQLLPLQLLITPIRIQIPVPLLQTLDITGQLLVLALSILQHLLQVLQISLEIAGFVLVA